MFYLQSVFHFACANGQSLKVVKAYKAGIRILVGSASKNTIYSDLCLRQELGLPSFFKLASVARARAVWKFPTLKTVMALLMEQRHTAHKRSWVTGSIAWLKRYPGLDPAVLTWEEAKPLLEKYLAEQELKSASAKSISFRNWQRSDYRSTISFVQHANFHTHLAQGINWLVRARCSGIWTARQAFERSLVTGEVQGRCPRCMQEIAAPELEHVVLMCTAYAHQRQILRPVLEAIPEMDNQAQTLQVILGGKG